VLKIKWNIFHQYQKHWKLYFHILDQGQIMSMGAKYLTYNKKDNQTKRPPDKKIIRQMTIRPNNNQTK